MKMLGLLLGVLVLAYVGYRTMYGGRAVAQATPKERLDNVKQAAKRIEDDSAKAAEEALKKADPKD